MSNTKHFPSSTIASNDTLPASPDAAAPASGAAIDERPAHTAPYGPDFVKPVAPHEAPTKRMRPTRADGAGRYVHVFGKARGE